MRVVITGGGTYGHVSPLEPVAQGLREGDNPAEVLFIAQHGDSFADLLEIGRDIDSVKRIYAGKYRRYRDQSTLENILDVKTNLLNLRDVFYMGMGILQSVRILRTFKPDVVFGKGGYVSVPVGLAAHFLKIPLVIHESDSLPGMANRILGSKAQRIALGMPSTSGTFDKSKTTYTGIPLRSAFLDNSVSKKELKQTLRLNPTKPLLTVSGGSLGAEAINNALIANLSELLEIVQIVHITGDKNHAQVMKMVDRLGIDAKGYQALPFTSDLDKYFKASDLVVTRASATTICELAALKTATVLIPGRQLSDQIENAKVLLEKGAIARILEQELDADGDLLYKTVANLITNVKARTELENGLGALSKTSSAKEIIDILTLIGTAE